jgi:hypothetical protein
MQVRTISGGKDFGAVGGATAAGREEEGVDRDTVVGEDQPRRPLHRVHRERVLAGDSAVDLVGHGGIQVEALGRALAEIPDREGARDDRLRGECLRFAAVASAHLRRDDTPEIVLD